MGADAKMDRAQMEHLAKLASLSLTNDEAETLTHEVEASLRYVDELNQLDTSSVEPTANVYPAGYHEARQSGRTAWREDVIEPSLPREEALAQAPAAGESGFAVPAFVDAG
jgi:aspartyl-tRNA(Asn)/glutamyl-tRNA(Gln) amidotransferase subunit C